MIRCNRVDLSTETKQTKRTKRETQTSLCVFCLMRLVFLQLRFAVSVSFDGCSFVKMTCQRVLAKPRRPVILQKTCMHVNEGQ